MVLTMPTSERRRCPSSPHSAWEWRAPSAPARCHQALSRTLRPVAGRSSWRWSLRPCPGLPAGMLGYGCLHRTTRPSIRDGAFLPGTELWDEVGVDLPPPSPAAVASAQACRAACDARTECAAWTHHGVSGTCSLKRRAERSLHVVTSAPCFQPNYAGAEPRTSTSGFKDEPNGARFAQLYVNRTRAWVSPRPRGKHWLGNWSRLLEPGVEPVATVAAAGCANLPSTGDPVTQCGEYCRKTAECAFFWVYTSGGSKGRCCPKAGVTLANGTRPLSGSFCAMDGPPTGPGSGTCTWGNCDYGHFGYATLLPILPEDRNITLHTFVDRSIVEVFGAGGRAVVTARVYPNVTSGRTSAFNAGTGAASLLRATVYKMGNAIEPS